MGHSNLVISAAVRRRGRGPGLGGVRRPAQEGEEVVDPLVLRVAVVLVEHLALKPAKVKLLLKRLEAA